MKLLKTLKQFKPRKVEGGVMEIQKLRQRFEELPDIKSILHGSDFGFNEGLNQYYHPDHTNHRLNYAFIMGAWMAWQVKAQAVPESNALLSASLDAIQKLGSGDFVLVKKVKLIEIIGAIAIIEPITRGNPYMDFVKRELNIIGNIANTAIKAQEQSHD